VATDPGRLPDGDLVKAAPRAAPDFEIRIFTTGGTIDKVYFDAKSTYEVGEPQIGEVLERSDVGFLYSIRTLCSKDSLDLTEEDRQAIRQAIHADPHRLIVVTHGTDTMVETARRLRDIPDKVIVLTGSSQPARFHGSNAIFNIGCAIGAVQILPPGVYIAMNGRIFDGDKVHKNPETRRFEPR
jgi:L-asparaginase